MVPALLRRALLPILALAALAGLPAGAAAQSLGAGGAGKAIEIDAEEGIEWHRKDKLYIARGDARATRGELTVYAEVLTAHYRTSDQGEAEIFRIEADGAVKLTSPSETAYGDKGVYDVDKGLLLLTGDNLRLVTEQDVVRARDSLEYWEDRKIAVARGEAVAERDDQEVRADVLTAYFQPNKTGDLELTTIRADGNVEITTPGEFASGDGGVYYVKDQIATLSGEVKITRGNDQVNGEYAEMNMATGVSRLLGAPPGQSGDDRVRGLLVPEDQEN
ncbi:MAG: LptA/OstA family protein [Kiloniellales bacterium]|nr:LptA/OstA family protein [Kiloniellales bacterium]